MSQAPSVPPASPPGGETAAPAKKRSSAEKRVVWGGIALLLLLVALQARARLGYSKTLEALQDRMAEDEGANANPLLVKDLHNYVFGWPSQKEEQKGTHLKTIELTWTGLPMTQPLGLIVACDPKEEEKAGGTVMGLETSGFVQPETPPQPAPTGAALGEAEPAPTEAQSSDQPSAETPAKQ
jgi:hypothetical protein